jgi:hypothetical protein
MKFLKKMLIATVLFAMLRPCGAFAELPIIPWASEQENESVVDQYEYEIYLTLKLTDGTIIQDYDPCEIAYLSHDGTTWKDLYSYDIQELRLDAAPLWTVVINTFRYEIPFEYQGTVYMAYSYYIRNHHEIYPTRCIYDPITNQLKVDVFYDKSPELPLITNEAKTIVLQTLPDMLVPSIPSDLIDPSAIDSPLINDKVKKCITKTWKLLPGIHLPESLEVTLSAADWHHLPIPHKQRAFVFTASHAANPSLTPNSTLSPSTTLSTSAVTRGYTFPDKYDSNKIILAVVPSQPGCEISFVTRVFGVTQGNTVLLEETHTPWSTQIAAPVTKPDRSRYSGLHVIIQYAADLRLQGSPEPWLTYIFDSK